MTPSPYWTDGIVSLYVGDCLTVLRTLPDASVDAVVTDPPYALPGGFMGKTWDNFDGREDAAFAYWFAGLVDGEGCFTIKRHTRGTHAPMFALKMRRDERGTLERICRTLGMGAVRDLPGSGGSQPQATYTVQDKAGCQRLVDLFDKYPLRAKKRLDYQIWRESVCEWTSRPRGNRWHGAADDSKMADLKTRLEEVRRYVDPPWSGHEFQDWCRLWAKECLRVLKPGGHMVAFGGTRTYHRMVCAIEDAGFEIRDSMHWIYGSGFPKSMDVGKAIDKAAGAEREVVGQKVYADGTAGHWTAAGTYAQDGHTKSLNGTSKTLTAPATDEARRWQGFGTALKPSHEPVVWAQKSFNTVPLDWRLVTHVHHALAGLLWLSLSPAKRAGTSSRSRNHAPDEAWCASARVSAALDTSPDASEATATYSSPELASTCSNIARSWNGILAVLSAQTSTSTTSTASSTTTALRTLSSLLAPITSPTTTPPCGCLLGGGLSSALSAGSGSSAEWSSWIDTLSRSVPESAIEGIALAASSALASIAADLSSAPGAASSARQTAMPSSGGCAGDGTPSRTAESSSAPAHEPIVLARRPLRGTVAANVLAHGTGALNIDGCRVAGTLPATVQGQSQNAGSKAGRWPTNVVLSHPPLLDDTGRAIGDACADGCVPGCPVAELDRQSGVGKTNRPSSRGAGGQHGAYSPIGAQKELPYYADEGGASRFFPVFRYEAKAPASERPRLPDGTAHATVKPLALMRWLVRLVTPPGGLVLDPFAGSGTTAEACVIEGFRSLLIEQDPAHAELIRARLGKPIQPTLEAS